MEAMLFDMLRGGVKLCQMEYFIADRSFDKRKFSFLVHFKDFTKTNFLISSPGQKMRYQTIFRTRWVQYGLQFIDKFSELVNKYGMHGANWDGMFFPYSPHKILCKINWEW